MLKIFCASTELFNVVQVFIQQRFGAYFLCVLEKYATNIVLFQNFASVSYFFFVSYGVNL